MNVSVQDYEQLRAWFAHVSRRTLPPELLRPEIDPVAQLDRLAAHSVPQARKGLSMAIADVIDLTEGWAPELVAAIDEELQQLHLPTLTDMRVRCSKLVQRVVRRGRIKDDAEYHAVRNAAELQEGSQLWALLASYEEQVRR